jgi:cyclomaltodextrinase
MIPPAQDRPQPPAGPAASGLANNVATAPGDLPIAAVHARFASQREQFRHDNTITPLAPGPDEAVLVEATTGEGMSLSRAAVFYTIDGSMPDAGSISVPMEAATVDWDSFAGFLTRWRAQLPPQPAGTVVRYRIGGWRKDEGRRTKDEGRPINPQSAIRNPQSGGPDIWAHDGQGFWFRVPWPAGISTFAYLAQPRSALLPAWASEAVVYQIFVDRFHPGDPDGKFQPAGQNVKHGGTLPGIRQALPYLADLGVTCLWLTPVCEAPSYHRYDCTDFYKIDPLLGSEADLRDLVQDAHARRIRVVLDFVPSHSSTRHPAFLAAQRDMKAESFSWFTFYEWPNRYRTFLDMVHSMPSFNTEDPGARAYLIGSALHWMRECGVDGYRIDHAIGPGMDFWIALRTATEQVDPESILFGEATDTPDSLRRYRGRLHGVLDFPLAAALRHVFALRDWDVERFAGYLDSYEQYMQIGPGRLSFIDNHDMNRFLFLAGNDTQMLKMAALCQFTLDAIPIIYYGTEIGMSQEYAIEKRELGGDAQARANMPWDQTLWNEDLLAYYRALIRMRREHPVLVSGKRRTLYLDSQAGLLGYVRSGAEGPGLASGDMLVLFNLSHSPCSLDIPLAAGHRALPLLETTPHGVVVRLEGAQTAITLPAKTGVLLRIEGV